MRSWNFQADGPVRLDGEWEFYWLKLAEPGELPAASQKPTYSYFPELWNDKTIDGKALGGTGYATYALMVVLPADHSGLSMSIEDFFSSYKLYINGALFSRNGTPGTSADSYVPLLKPLTKPLKPGEDTLRLVLQVANFHHYKGGSAQSIVIGPLEEMSLIREQELAYDWILAGAMFMGGLFFFGLYLFGRHDKAMLFFSLFCIVYSYRNIGSDLYAVNLLVKELSGVVAFRLEHAGVFLSLFFFTEYLLKLYPDEIYQPALRTFNWINLALFIASVAGPVMLFTSVLPYYLLILLVAIIYAAYVVVMAAIHEREGAVYAVLGKMAVFAIVSYNVLVYFGLTPRLIIFNFLAHIIFFFFESLILSFRFASSLTKAKEAAESSSKAKTEFLSTMSHEIRTPLNAVVGMTNFLLEDEPKPEQKENLQTLKFSAEHLVMLISDVLDYSKIEAGKIEFTYEPADLRSLAAQVIKVHEKKALDKGLDLRYTISPEIPDRILCDKIRMIQVISNLVDNAVKFTQKGFVRLNISLLEGDTEKVKLLFEVIDSGIGIDAGQHELIFERFSQANATTTREFGGSGLGLSIIRKLLQLQGVDIKLISTPGSGSRFSFEQWFQKAFYKKPEVEADSQIPGEKPLKGKKILVVEDNRVNVLVVKKFLEKWGAAVDVASNGLIAVDEVREGNHHLVLMDLQMPVMDGYEACVKIREFNKSIPVIAITASVLMDVQERIFKAGMNDFITKPFVPEDLLNKLRRYLEANA